MTKVTKIYDKQVYGVILDDGRTFTCIKINDNGNKILKVQQPEGLGVTPDDVRLVTKAVDAL